MYAAAEQDQGRSAGMDARISIAAPTLSSLSVAHPKSALSLQLEQFDQGTFKSSVSKSSSSSSNLRGHFKRSERFVSNDRQFLRKVSKMINDEDWNELDRFLRSPEEVAAYRAGDAKFNMDASFKWQKTQVGRNQVDDNITSLASSVNSMSLNMASIGSDDLNPMEIVHFACRFNPPRTIVRQLASLYPDGVMYTDKLNRLPLHYAAKWGASSRLISYLVEKDRTAASVKDSLGKTPLHLLCANYSHSMEEVTNDTLSLDDHMVESTKTLIKACPDAVNIVDNNDTTAIEYAIASDCPIKAVRLIQKASEDDWKERRKAHCEEDTHEQIEEKLIRDQQLRQQAEKLQRETNRMNGVLTGKVQLNNTQLPSSRRRPTSNRAMAA